MDTIYALSSGQPPAAIAIIRISGHEAAKALTTLAGTLPEPRKASLRTLRNASADILDHALVLWFPGPETATGEDLSELHCHGGRAVVAAIRQALADIPGLREAKPGEFTRRAFLNGRMDLSEAEGLADLLAAETELQRRSALSLTSGQFSHQVEAWRSNILALGAEVESVLDFGDEDDVTDLPPGFPTRVAELADELASWLARPRAEKLRDGIKVVLAGPPNSGKSTLFNALLEEAAAITSPEAGTTRDAIERAIAVEGVPLVLIDTAGLRTDWTIEIEAIGIARANEHVERADIVLWLGPEGQGPEGAIEVMARIDEDALPQKRAPDFRVSAETGEGIAALRTGLAERARDLLPQAGAVALNQRQHALVRSAQEALSGTSITDDLLILAEHLRIARASFDSLIGRSSTEDMLDTLFARFCIGK